MDDPLETAKDLVDRMLASPTGKVHQDLPSVITALSLVSIAGDQRRLADLAHQQYWDTDNPAVDDEWTQPVDAGENEGPF